MLTEYQEKVDFDKEIEANVISILINNPNAYSSTQGVLEPGCFHDSDYRFIYETIGEIWEAGHIVEMFTLANAINSKKVLIIKGLDTSEYIMKICSLVFHDTYLLQWSLLLREMYARRLMKQITTSGINSDKDVFVEADSIQQRLKRVLEVRIANNWKTSAQAAKLLLDKRDETINNNKTGLSTSFPTIDHVNGGLAAGDFAVLAARPSVGKSAIADQVAIAAAKKGKPVLYISLEMPAESVLARMASKESGISYSKIDRKKLSNEENELFMSTLSTISNYKIHFADNYKMNITDIRVAAEKMHQQHGIGLMIVDYLQLIEETPGDKNRTREQAVSRISRGLKTIALQLKIPVLALSQLNRGANKRADKKPTMDDLRESGAIEQDADIIMLLHRDWREGIKTDSMGESTETKADLIIPKWRNGKTTKIELHFEGRIMHFTEFSGIKPQEEEQDLPF
jgi:replicative DNA helicase